MLREDRDWEGLEVVFELPQDDDESKYQLFQPLVSGLWSIQGMAVCQLLHAFFFPN